MSSDLAISIRDVSKHYLMFERPEDRLKQMIVPRLQRLAGRQPRRYFRDFAALNGISFDVERGETIGIIGRNGCGKSTLLQIVCGTLQPTSGTVTVNGRIAALLELGAGFNPEFTGRENVFLNASILGLSHAETEARFDDIARFADIGMFIDQPVKTYSSGMYVRLAFATAINVDPDILVVDEALAVGDEAFQRKCYARIEDIKARGGTILFVSHGAQTIVQLCDRAMLIDRGEKILEGRPKTVVNQYQRLVNLSGPDAEPVREAIKAMDGWGDSAVQRLEHEPTAGISDGKGSSQASSAEDDESWFDPTLQSHSQAEYGNSGALICDLHIETTSGRRVNNLSMGHTYVLTYYVDFDVDAKDVSFGTLIKTITGFELGGAGTNLRQMLVPHVSKGQTYHVRFRFTCRLCPGLYFMNAGVGCLDGEWLTLHRILDGLAFRVIGKDVGHSGVVDFSFQPEFRMVEDAPISTPERHLA